MPQCSSGLLTPMNLVSMTRYESVSETTKGCGIRVRTVPLAPTDGGLLDFALGRVLDLRRSEDAAGDLLHRHRSLDAPRSHAGVGLVRDVGALLVDLTLALVGPLRSDFDHSRGLVRVLRKEASFQ